MSEFQLDTSGAVWAIEGEHEEPHRVYWSDLSPFVHGYVEAMLRELYENYEQPVAAYRFRFDDLAPETLARIMELAAKHPNAQPHKFPGNTARQMRSGRYAWGDERRSLSLNDDGKVVFQ